MPSQQPQYSKEEFARLGDEIYYRDIFPKLQPNSVEKIVAVDIITGAWEINFDEIAASSRLEKLYPDAQIWIVRVGSRYVRRFGASRSRKAKTA
ncbi:MAG: hypothetical protein HC836_47710 [Richelia sp. RM2_1_2]|nr:hypothetical protein [Richelia sp. RM2_1_2]